MSVIGIDLDGVLANFNSAYVKRVIEVTGEDRFGVIDWQTFPSCWSYDVAAGYTEQQITAVWKSIKKDPWFWQSLSPIPGAIETLEVLDRMRHEGNDIYFITNRPGYGAKLYTERWLASYSCSIPTVIISANKGLYVTDLGMDAYIDDNTPSANEVMREVREADMLTRVYLRDASYNQAQRDVGLVVVPDVWEMLRLEGWVG